MKKKLLSAIAALSFAIAGQTQPATKAEGAVYNFKPRKATAIDLRKSKDSTYTYISQDGIVLWLIVKNKEVVKTRMFKATGEEITIIPDSNAVAKVKRCMVCYDQPTDNGNPKGGGTKKVCVPALCHDVESINKGLSRQL